MNDNDKKILGKKTKFEDKEDQKQEIKKDENKNKKKGSNFNTINGIKNKNNLFNSSKKPNNDKNININKKGKKGRFKKYTNVNKKKEDENKNNCADDDNINYRLEDSFINSESRAFFEECDEKFDTEQFDISQTVSNQSQNESSPNIHPNSTINSSSLIKKIDNLNI